MRLYHFCCDHVAPDVRLRGLMKGCLWTSVNNKMVIRPGFQWLTSDPEWSAQRWADRVSLKCDRTDFRATVELPERPLFGRLRDWTETKTLLRLLGCDEEAILNGYERPGSATWHTFEGSIPVSYFAAFDENPGRTGRTGHAMTAQVASCPECGSGRSFMVRAGRAWQHARMAEGYKLKIIREEALPLAISRHRDGCEWMPKTTPIPKEEA